MALRWLPCGALLVVACTARPAGAPSTPATEPATQPFHVALPVLAMAERAANQDDMAEASRLFQLALPLGVRSREMFFEAAWMASRRGAVDVAFADLEGLRALGIADTRKIETRQDLEPVRRDPRWPAWLEHATAAARPVYDPDAARISTDDVDRFWKAYDDAKAASDPAAIYDREYVDPASPALQAFLALRVGTAEDLAARVREYAPYYESVRTSTLRVRALEPRFRAMYRRLRELVPDATFPDVTFVIGGLKSQGSSTVDGLIIGAEQACRMPDSPLDGMEPRQRDLLGSFDDLDHLVAHELVHFQQHFGSEASLLDQALKEGGADFVAELISGATLNGKLQAYGDAHEAELWSEFRAETRSTDGTVKSRWLYGGPPTPDRPRDLGYYVGYRVARAYYRSHSESRRALRDILDVTDSQSFLEASGY